MTTSACPGREPPAQAGRDPGGNRRDAGVRCGAAQHHHDAENEYASLRLAQDRSKSSRPINGDGNPDRRRRRERGQGRRRRAAGAYPESGRGGGNRQHVIQLRDAHSLLVALFVDRGAGSRRCRSDRHGDEENASRDRGAPGEQQPCDGPADHHGRDPGFEARRRQQAHDPPRPGHDRESDEDPERGQRHGHRGVEMREHVDREDVQHERPEHHADREVRRDRNRGRRESERRPAPAARGGSWLGQSDDEVGRAAIHRDEESCPGRRARVRTKRRGGLRRADRAERRDNVSGHQSGTGCGRIRSHADDFRADAFHDPERSPRPRDGSGRARGGIAAGVTVADALPAILMICRVTVIRPASRDARRWKSARPATVPRPVITSPGVRPRRRPGRVT